MLAKCLTLRLELHSQDIRPLLYRNAWLEGKGGVVVEAVVEEEVEEDVVVEEVEAVTQARR